MYSSTVEAPYCMVFQCKIPWISQSELHGEQLPQSCQVLLQIPEGCRTIVVFRCDCIVFVAVGKSSLDDHNRLNPLHGKETAVHGACSLPSICACWRICIAGVHLSTLSKAQCPNRTSSRSRSLVPVIINYVQLKALLCLRDSF